MHRSLVPNIFSFSKYFKYSHVCMGVLAAPLHTNNLLSLPPLKKKASQFAKTHLNSLWNKFSLLICHSQYRWSLEYLWSPCQVLAIYHCSNICFLLILSEKFYGHLARYWPSGLHLRPHTSCRWPVNRLSGSKLEGSNVTTFSQYHILMKIKCDWWKWNVFWLLL